MTTKSGIVIIIDCGVVVPLVVATRRVLVGDKCSHRAGAWAGKASSMLLCMG